MILYSVHKSSKSLKFTKVYKEDQEINSFCLFSATPFLLKGSDQPGSTESDGGHKRAQGFAQRGARGHYWATGK